MKSQAKAGSRVRRLSVAAAGVVLVLGASACAATAKDEPKDERIAAKAEAARPHGHHRGPVAMVIDAALAHCDLSADQQQTLRAIARELEEDHQSRREAGEQMRSSAVAIVRSGTSDSAEFERAVGQAARLIEERMDRGADALEEIHATLDAQQRATLAGVLRARVDERFGRRHQHEKRHRTGFERLAAHLMLSTLQIEQLKAMKKELFADKDRLRPSREELLGLVDAFEGEDFRPALDAFRAKKSAALRDRLAEAGERTDSALGVLSADQRELLADLIQDGPEKVLLGEPATPAPQ
jgi:Spy/CpxP family protein refolding chaperone